MHADRYIDTHMSSEQICGTKVMCGIVVIKINGNQVAEEKQKEKGRKK